MTTDYQPLYNNSYALVMGIDRYHELQPLTAAVRGAVDLTAVLRDKYGFEATLLTNDEVTRNAVFGWFDDISHNAEDDDRVLIYFSGHGLTRGSGYQQRGYLALTGSKPGEWHTMLAMDDISDETQFFKAKHLLYVLDCCFGGIALTKSGLDYPRELDYYLTRSSRYAISAGGEEVVDDSLAPDYEHSIFSYFLLKWLREVRPPSGIWRAREMAIYLEEEVARFRRSGHKPCHAPLPGSGDGDFVFRWEVGPRLPRDIELAIQSSNVHVRWGVVAALIELARGSDETNAVLARERLAQLAQHDTDERVRMAAQSFFDEEEAIREAEESGISSKDTIWQVGLEAKIANARRQQDEAASVLRQVIEEEGDIFGDTGMFEKALAGKPSTAQGGKMLLPELEEPLPGPEPELEAGTAEPQAVIPQRDEAQPSPLAQTEWEESEPTSLWQRLPTGARLGLAFIIGIGLLIGLGMAMRPLLMPPAAPSATPTIQTANLEPTATDTPPTNTPIPTTPTDIPTDQPATRVPVEQIGDVVIPLAHAGDVRDVAWSPDGHSLATGSAETTVNLWDVDTQTIIDSLQGHANYVYSVDWSPDGSLIASGSADTNVIIWRVDIARPLYTLSDHQNSVWSVAFSPDGKLLASGSEDNRVILWDVATGNMVRELVGHSFTVAGLAWSPDGSILASASWDNSIILWDVATGVQLIRLLGHANDVNSVSWTQDGQRLISGSADGTIIIWDVEDIRESEVTNPEDLIQNILRSGHTDVITSVDCAPDGRSFASASRDSSIIIWDLETGTPVRILSDHSNWVWQIAWSPDGSALASASRDTSAIVWKIET